MHDYPEQFVDLDIVEVDVPGNVLNTGRKEASGSSSRTTDCST